MLSALKKAVGLEPASLLAAPRGVLEGAIQGGGMQPAHRAAKVRRCAEVAIEYADGDLSRALRSLPLQNARALLKRFPGIGDPGAEKILLLCGFADGPSVDSNGIRVLERLRFVASDSSYARQYRASVAALSEANFTGLRAAETFALLREHGRELCKRSKPLCEVCPLRKDCEYARSVRART